MSSPLLLLVDRREAGLLTDLYELTMAAGYLQTGFNPPAVFELFIRELPPDRGYLVAAGLEQALTYLQALHFDEEGVEFLRRHPSFAQVSPSFFDWLRGFRFSGQVWAVPEGTVVFAEEPILRVEAPIAEAQVVETYLLSTLTYQTMVATKSARVAEAAGSRRVVDFGSRRAHGPQAGLLAARAAYVGGCAGTSNVLAGKLMGIPLVGTAAHSWTMAFGDEEHAFAAYHRVFPESTILLVDTYDTLAGTRRAAAVAGKKLKGVRLDSGDLAALSRRVREILDEAGLTAARIVASGDLNEYRIADLLAAGAPIDLFGVGTDLVTSRDAPALGGVYKLVAVQRGGRWQPCHKHSPGKATYPWPKQVFRRSDGAGRFVEDLIARADEEHPGRPLLRPMMRNGRLIEPLPSLEEIRNRARDEVSSLEEGVRRLRGPARYPVRVSDTLARATRDRPT